MPVLELYAGIGGVAASGVPVVAAIDQDVYAHAVYTANFEHPAHRLNLVSVKPDRLRAFGADVWWMSERRRCRKMPYVLYLAFLV